MNTPTLENNRAKLIPLTIDNYGLISHIAAENKLIQFSPSDISTPKKFKEYVETALKDRDENKAMPFIIFDKQTETYAGCTRLGLMDWHNKVAHIGWTWIGREHQGTGLNKQMKFLMMQYLFETLKFEKLEFRIDERNQQSRKAVEKLGAKFEGVLRSNTVMLDGFRRSTCCYGMLRSEWPNIKKTVF